MTPDVPQTPIVADDRTYMAAERTLLAWVRTGLALMGFGFVVARFGLFLRELAAAHDLPPVRSGLSLWIGTALVVIGVIVNMAAAFHHGHTVRRLQRGQPLVFSPWSMAVILALLLAVLGGLMALYLVFGLREPVPPTTPS